LGALATQYTYEPFGKTAPFGIPSDNSIQYTGRENDDTGLYFYRARNYSPALQRFTSQDPIGRVSGSLKPYVYAGNNPLRSNDPSGLLEITPRMTVLAYPSTGAASEPPTGWQPPFDLWWRECIAKPEKCGGEQGWEDLKRRWDAIYGEQPCEVLEREISGRIRGFWSALGQGGRKDSDLKKLRTQLDDLWAEFHRNCRNMPVYRPGLRPDVVPRSHEDPLKGRFRR
jgi:RHS repeat-associated protein